jgi:ketosteroid isomerase-like protein
MATPKDQKIARIRDLYDAMNRGDLDRAVQMAHPDVVFVRVGGQGELRGPEAIRGWMEPDAFEEQAYEPLDFESSGDRTLVRVHTAARGSASGIEVEINAWVVFTFGDDGLIVRTEVFLEHEEDAARRALRG